MAIRKQGIRAGTAILAILVGASALSCGGSTKKLVRPGVCFADTETTILDSEVRSFWPEDWFDLLLHQFDRYSKVPDRRPRICDKRRLIWPKPFSCEIQEADPTPLKRVQISDKELVFKPVGKNERLVWAIVRRYDTGEAFGAVGLAKFDLRGVYLKAVGPLRAPGQRVTMDLKSTRGGKVLLVEGELCKGKGDKACPRYVRALLMQEGRFIPKPLTNKFGECKGPAYFPLTRSATKTMSASVERRYLMTSRVQVRPAGIIVHEHLTVHDVDIEDPETNPRLRRRAEIDRLVRVVGGRFIPEAQSLWDLVEVEMGTAPNPDDL